MKLTGLLGTGSGKLGNSVFATIAGEQIVRQYQPVVANPSTTAQVGQRAKFKLLSQLAASMASEIAIPKDGMKSSRNLFIALNNEKATETAGAATIDLAGIQLTKSNRAFAGSFSLKDNADNASFDAIIGATTVSGEDGTTRGLYDYAVVVMYGVEDNMPLRLIDSQIVNISNGNPTVVEHLRRQGEPNKVVAYIYGVSTADAKASAKYESYGAVTASDVARLISSRTISTSDLLLTATKGAVAEHVIG